MVMRKVLQTKGVRGDVSIISIENNGYVLIFAGCEIIDYIRFGQQLCLNAALCVCVMNLVFKIYTIEMLTFLPMHRFCSNIAHFNGMEALTSDPS